MPCQGVSGANIGNWLNSNAKKKWIWPSLGFAALPRGGGESGKPDMRLRVNPAVFSHDWTLKDARRCDQQLAGWIAMEWLRQLGGFHQRFEGSRCLGCSRSGRETHQPKCGCPAESPQGVPVLAGNRLQRRAELECACTPSVQGIWSCDVLRGVWPAPVQGLTRLWNFPDVHSWFQA